ncbi:hypothetical protein CLV30_11263 [Haloactinopolyspora alba]|uniref:Very-short-patch-repair endonuclease n=1 Tax=Haloactinopolyspora alba TaxID=648780 RepID=A0A2P8DX81_9ACTN|nr:hypothetical protein [Haloactinopolyspora alba]PSL01824.1 hypothetical protein CLV30_11263 [Haloactinopolyspora alba]
MRVPDEVVRVAREQDGLVTRSQALSLGMTVAAVRHALGDGGRWQRVLDGVYADFTGPLQQRHVVRAALLRAGPGAVVTGVVACRGYGLRYVPHGPLMLLVPADVQRSCRPVAVLRRVRSMPLARELRGVPVAPPERAVVDACVDRTRLREVRALLCESVQTRLTTPERIRTQAGAARWKGARLVRQALDDVAAGCRSAPECELRDLVRSSAVLAEPRWNEPLPDGTGGLLVPDACWAEARVVVEIDSAEWHRGGEAVERTERRRARYAALGWAVVPISPRRLREEPASVLNQIEDAVTAGSNRSAA